MVGTEYVLNCFDSYGDGWNGSYMNIDGTPYCDDFEGFLFARRY